MDRCEGENMKYRIRIGKEEEIYDDAELDDGTTISSDKIVDEDFGSPIRSRNMFQRMAYAKGKALDVILPLFNQNDLIDLLAELLDRRQIMEYEKEYAKNRAKTKRK